MSFARHLGALLLTDGLEQIRTHPSYLLLSGVLVDLSGLSAGRRLGLEQCLGGLESCRTYTELTHRLGPDGDLAALVARIPVGAQPTSGELWAIVRDLARRRGLRDGREVFDTGEIQRWFVLRLAQTPTLEQESAHPPPHGRAPAHAPRTSA